MKTEIVNIFSNGEGRDGALELTERTGAYCGLDSKSALRLRLLSEELIELIRPFAGDLQGDFWLETEGSNIEIHLKTEIPMDLQTRKELLAVSSTGKNAAAKGIIGKIREMIATATLPDDPETRVMADQALGLIALGSQVGSHYGGAEAYSWSMTNYVTCVNTGNIDLEVRQEAQDELERSIVANLADEVKVNIVKSEVEVAIYKSFG